MIFSRSKKGNITDLIVKPVFLFAIALVIILGLMIISNINDFYGSQPDSTISAKGKTAMSSIATQYPSTFDTVFAFIFVGLAISIIVSAYFIDAVPVLLPFLIIIMAIFIYVSATISNAWYAVASADQIAIYSQKFVIMNWVLLNIPVWLAIEGPMMLIALFGKLSKRGE